MILVLLSPRNAGLPFAEWLSEEAGALLAVTAHDVPEGPGFRAVARVGAYGDDGAVLAAARRLSREFPVTRVLALAEVDVERAALLREELGLPGQRPASARAYRDKVEMKLLAREAGLLVPRFSPVSCAADITAFGQSAAAPVVVKPRGESGSTGVTVVEDPRHIAPALADRVAGGGYEVEEFVTGRLHHVDALRVDGEPVVAVPSSYTDGGCLSHWTDAGNGSWTLPSDDPLHARLTERTWTLVDALPAAPSLFVHAEYFVTGTGDIVLCEIAARVGGTPIPAMLKAVLGVDPRQLWARVECGLPVDTAAVREHLRASAPVANFGLPPRNGRITRVPDRAPAGALEFSLLAGVGDDWGGARYRARKSGDFVATWTVTAAGLPDLLGLLEKTAAEVESGFGWDLATDGPR